MLRRDLVGELEEFGAAAVFLDDYVARWMANHRHPPAEAAPTINGDLEPIGGGRIPIEGPAARAFEAGRGRKREGRPSQGQRGSIKKVVTEKFPPLWEGETRSPTEGMPRWNDGKVFWKEGGEGD